MPWGATSTTHSFTFFFTGGKTYVFEWRHWFSMFDQQIVGVRYFKMDENPQVFQQQIEMDAAWQSQAKISLV
jgi:hypothetical protein